MIALINPNTSTATTASMLRIARETAGPDVDIRGFTAPFGASLITNPQALAEAEHAVMALAPELSQASAVIIAAFGDPGLSALRERLHVPVTGIAEAGMQEAAEGKRTFAVVTTTPDLVDPIAEMASRNGHATFIGTWTTKGDPASLMSNASDLRDALAEACARAVRAGAGAIVIGGGPLAQAARDLSATSPVPLIEPLPAAVRLSLTRLGQGGVQ